MIELTNESMGDENYKDEIEISNESHLAAKQSILDKLNSSKDGGLREIAINDLIKKEVFWDHVFSVGANLSMNRDELFTDSVNIGVHVFTSIAEEVHDLSLKMEKELLT